MGATMIGVGPPGDSANFLEKVLDATPTPNNGDDNFHTEKKTIDLNVYNFMPASVSSTQYFFNGSMTTPPCNPGPTYWVMATEPVYVEQSTVDRYRALINSNPNNQLSPFGTIVGTRAGSPPVFNSLAGSVDWDTSLGSNNRPLQPLTGSDNPTRKLYKLGSPPSDVSTTVIIVLIALVGLGAVAFFFLKGQQNPTKAREQNDPIYSVLDET